MTSAQTTHYHCSQHCHVRHRTTRSAEYGNPCGSRRYRPQATWRDSDPYGSAVPCDGDCDSARERARRQNSVLGLEALAAVATMEALASVALEAEGEAGLEGGRA